MHWRLLSLGVTGILLTLGLCRGRSVGEDDSFESTTPDYDYENTTFEYYFFSNGSGTINYEIYEVLHEKETNSNSASGISLSASIILLAMPIQHLFYLL